MPQRLALVLQKAETVVGEFKIVLPSGGDAYRTLVDYLKERNNHRVPAYFSLWLEGLRAVWPELFKSNKEAFLLCACEMYIQGAEDFKFGIEPEQLVGGQYDTFGVHGDTSRDDRQTVGERT